MNILILGSGGREHVFALKLSQSALCKQVFTAPGNAGTAQCGINLDLSPLDFDSIGKACTEYKIQMLIPAGEDALVAGIVDYFASKNELKHIFVLGPDKAAARLEGSKDFSKDLMRKYQIPTAAYCSVDSENLQEGLAFLESMKPPYVLKADGLAAGKGVLIVDNLLQAKSDLKEMLAGKFGTSSKKVIIEEFLRGIELSFFVLCDGTHYMILPEAKDYKRIGENDTGLNTGGMGAVSPVSFADAVFLKKVEEQIVIPTLNGLKNENISYRGFLFIGLMKTGNEPKVIEYNCRMGDPETEVVFHRIENDFVQLFQSACEGRLNKETLSVNPQTAVTVMLVSGGYPEAYTKGYEIQGLENTNGSTLYHAGTIQDGEKLLSNGGRVMAITSMTENITLSLKLSMDNAKRIDFTGKYYRKDIGMDLLTHHEHI